VRSHADLATSWKEIGHYANLSMLAEGNLLDSYETEFTEQRAMAQSDIREYEARAVSTDLFGRVLCSARNHHFVVDGPVQNGCPGEEVTPAEIFLAGVASCGVELVQVLAKSAGIELQGLTVRIQGRMDRSKPVRPDVSLFNSVRLEFQMSGVNDQEARQLVETFKGR